VNDIITIVFILVIHLSHICYLNMQSNWHQTAFKVQWGCQGDQATTNPQKAAISHRHLQKYATKAL